MRTVASINLRGRSKLARENQSLLKYIGIFYLSQKDDMSCGWVLPRE